MFAGGNDEQNVDVRL